MADDDGGGWLAYLAGEELTSDSRSRAKDGDTPRRSRRAAEVARWTGGR